MPEEYLNFDNYQGIDMNVSEVPSDYDEIMGVPITYLDKHNPEQFEVLGIACRGYSPEYRIDYKMMNIMRKQMI